MTVAYQLKNIDRTVFRAYDIRGIVGVHFDENGFYTIGKAIAYQLHKLRRDTCYLARDGRLSSEQLALALKTALLESGINVLDLGAVATPVMYYATKAFETDSGLMVTGSHNPAEYNGIKMVIAGKTLVQKDIDELYQHVVHKHTYEGHGVEKSMNIIEQYVERILSDIKLQRSFKVVVDCGNGIAGRVIPGVIKKLGCEVIPLYCEVDGNFPNHHPDPTIEENLKDLKVAVHKHQADIGLAFDGDADRLGVVTNKGEVIWPDRLMMMFSKAILQKNPGATIVYDVKCSKDLKFIINESGGVPRMCPTGHSIVKGIMKEINAPLAGEMSGHLFFNDRWYGFDDALYSACRLLETLSLSPSRVCEQFATIPNSVNTPELKIPIADEKKFIFMEQFSAKANFKDAQLINIDGLRVEFAKGWGLLRASNTTPCLVARFEAEDTISLEDIKSLFKIQLSEVDKDLVVPF